MENRWKIPVQLRWSDMDPNFHLRHSAYYDFGAMARIAMLAEVGMNEAFFREHQFGPILMKEECTFRKEIRLTDEIFITGQLLQCRTNGTRFTMVHDIVKADDTLAARIMVWGDWIDYSTRKLLHPPPFLADLINRLQKHPEFSILK